MRKLLTALCATAALGAAPAAHVRAQTAQDTLGRVLEGLQGGQDQRRAPEGYRDDDRRRDDRSYRDDDRRRDERDVDRRGAREGDDRRPAADSGRRLDDRQRRLDDERRPVEEERRRPDRDRR
jgi:hypothetical protein